MAVAVEHGQVERAEVAIEVLVHEFIVDAEVVGVGGGLGSQVGAQRHKIQPVCGGHRIEVGG